MDNKLIIFMQWFLIWKRLMLYPIAFGDAEYLNLYFEIRITKILVTIVPQEARISRTLKNVFIKIIYSLKIRKRKFGFLLKKLLSEGTSNCNNHIFNNRPALSKLFQVQ